MILLKVLLIALLAAAVVLLFISGWVPGFLNKHVKELQLWRKSLTIGDLVKIKDGAVEFDAQIVHLWEDRVQIISNDMRVAAYPFESIYPRD
jgi:hypothetical protein